MKITARDLEHYADNELAKGLLPELMRRLVRASSDEITGVYFPSGESTFTPGADGVVRSVEGSADVPQGVSVWELSTKKRPQSKARGDFEKRCKPTAKQSYEDQPLSEVTYVAVTMRRWPGREGIDRDSSATDLRRRGIWKDVRIIDAIYLEEWLDRTPSVLAWLLRKMDRGSDDILSIEDNFDDYAQGTNPEIKIELLLVNRDRAKAEFIEAATSGALVRLRADSPMEAAAFAAAAIKSIPDGDPRREHLLAKGIVITNPKAKQLLKGMKGSLCVLTVGPANEIAQWLSNNGHTVVACYGMSHSKTAGHSKLIKLPRGSHHQFAGALQAMGMEELEANRAAARCHSSVSVFWRQGDLAHSRRPEWASPSNLRGLVGPIFCGAFAHGSTADQEVLAVVAGDDYKNVEERIADVLFVDDAPILREGELTALSAPADIWQLSIDQQVITREMLDRFRHAALGVLAELDPALELPPEKRGYAAIYAKSREHSGQLRAGISEVLRLIAINEAGLSYLPGFSAQHYVDQIVARIPGLPSDYRVLASLDPLLPVLAEAAPIPFLEALEELIAGDGSALSPIFEGSDDVVFGRSYYLGVLRGLEILAWSPDLLERVSALLARISLIDPGGNLSNRPINSLIQIYLPWRPHTNASAEVRNRSLVRVCEAVPEVAWNLLAGLLPLDRAISFGTTGPEWREFGASERVEPTYGSVARDYEFVIRHAVTHAGTNALRWIELVRSASESGLERSLDELLRLLGERHGEFRLAGTASELWEKLTGLADKHHGFSDADWAMSSEWVERIRSVASLFTPVEPLALYRPLFDHHLMERTEPGETFESRQARTEQARDLAVAEIARGGAKAVVDFAQGVKVPHLLAPSLARNADEALARSLVLEGIRRHGDVAWLVAVVAANAVAKFGFPWGVETVKQLEGAATPEEIATVLLPWNFSSDLLRLLDDMPQPVRESYWLRRNNFVFPDDPDLVPDFVARMMIHGRSTDLIEFLGARDKRVSAEVLLEVLERGLEELAHDPDKVNRVNRYWLGKVFEGLRAAQEVERDRLLKLEYQWLPLLFSYGDPQPLALHDHLRENPEFFVEVLSDLYKSDAEVADAAASDESDDEVEGEEDSKGAGEHDADFATKRARASFAHKLLESWRILPSQTADGDLDAERILDWVREALRLAAEVGRHEVAAREIGKLLAYAPTDKLDSIWPARDVRQVIEVLANSQMEGAIVLEIFNKRGAHWRPQEGGGGPERELAAAASEASRSLASEWPRTSRMLQDSAEQWIRHAEWHDRRAAEESIEL